MNARIIRMEGGGINEGSSAPDLEFGCPVLQHRGYEPCNSINSSTEASVMRRPLSFDKRQVCTVRWTSYPP